MPEKRLPNRTRRRAAPTKLAAMRMPPKLLTMASKKAAKMGISRTKYVEQLLRRDLGLEGVDLSALERTSVFG